MEGLLGNSTGHAWLNPDNRAALEFYERSAGSSSGSSSGEPPAQSSPQPGDPEPQKRGPKPKHEGPHNQTVDKRIEELKGKLGEDWEHVGGGSKTEFTVKTPGGTKDSRRLDITFRNKKTGKLYHEQVGRTEKSTGQPVKREREAIDDINEATGIKPKFTPYDRTYPPPPTKPGGE
jgi:hypothetical protein